MSATERRTDDPSGGTYGPRERSEDFGSLVKRGKLTAAEYEAFVGTLEELGVRDEYFFAITMFSYVGRKVSD